jgi:conflict system STAND superfamily ATPase
LAPPDSTAGSASVDAQHPWLGLDSFTEETRAYFYGRDEEVAELARRVQRKLLTILFGQSGLGKTSILRAGIVPRLRAQGYCPVYVRIDYSPESPDPSEQIKQAIFRATLSSGRWTQPGVAVAGESLWEFLHHRDDVLRDAEGRTVIPLLIFDQFEEIFTLAQSDDFGRKRAAQFLEDLGDLVENRPPAALEARLNSDGDDAVEEFDFTRSDYRVLIALREDYLAHLEGVKAIMPSIGQNRMRLARMTGEQALDAVVKPGGKLVNQEVAESIVRFVAGGSELRNAEVEPSLLSLICRELNNARIAQGRAEISADLLAGSRDTILSEFYERALADQPPGVRKFVEDEMLTESGFRENLAEERVAKAFAAGGAPPDALATLVNRRLLRIEERLDLRRVELTHDVLCSVVKTSREARHEREARDDAERRLQAQRERERATRKALVRARQVAAVCAVLAIGAVVGAIFGYLNMKRAQHAEARADATRLMAEQARGESEKLVVYLLDDFYRELEPVGRLNIVGELAKRAIDYYQALPAELRTPDTERNQALAQVRYGAVLRSQNKVDEARKVLGTAIPALDALRAKGDASEPTAIGLSLGLVAQSRAVDSGGQDRGTLPPAERAVAVLEPAAQASGASVALRRAYAAALTQLGYVQTRQNLDEAALVSLQTALAAYRSIDNLQGDGDAAANFGIATAWLMEPYIKMDRLADAARAGAEGLRATSQLLERQPTNMLALRSRGLISSGLATVAENELQPGRRLAALDDDARDWALLSRIDPSNMISKGNLLVSRINAAGALWDLGRPRASLTKHLENRESEVLAATSPLVAGSLSYSLYWAAIFAAELGQTMAAEKYLSDSLRHFETAMRGVPRASFDYDYWRAFVSVAPVEVANVQGDPARARAAAKGIRERLSQLQPTNDYDRQRVAELLRRLHLALGRAELQAGDYAAAQEHFSQVAEARKLLPTKALVQRRDAADDAALLAITLAHGGRIDEARALAEPALNFQRELHARKTDDQWHKWNLALALLAAARSTPAKSGALLAEAQAALDSLPAEARGVHASQMVQGLIADARRGSR